MARLNSIWQKGILFFARARVRSVVGHFLSGFFVISTLITPISAATSAEVQTINELKSTDQRKKFQAIQTLRLSRTAETGDALSALLANEKDVRTLLAALDSLASRGEPFRAGAVAPLLKHPVAAVRQRAAKTLGMLTGPAAERMLSRALRTEADSSVRSAIAQGLSLCGTSESVADLQSALTDKHPAVRANAAAALQQIPGKKAQPQPKEQPTR